MHAVTRALIALLLTGCGVHFAWQRPDEADAWDHEAWAAVRAESEAEWGRRVSCAEPSIWWTQTRAEASRICGTDGAWGCYLAPSDRQPYVVTWAGHRHPRRLVCSEMLRRVRDCLGLPEDRGYTDARVWGPGGVLDRAWERIR